MKSTILLIFGLMISISSFSKKDSKSTINTKEKFCIQDGVAPSAVSIDNVDGDENKLVLFNSYRLPTESEREDAKWQLHPIPNGNKDRLVLFNSYRLPTEFEKKSVKGQLYQIQNGGESKLILFNSYRFPTEFEREFAQPAKSSD